MIFQSFHQILWNPYVALTSCQLYHVMGAQLPIGNVHKNL